MCIHLNSSTRTYVVFNCKYISCVLDRVGKDMVFTATWLDIPL